MRNFKINIAALNEAINVRFANRLRKLFEPELGYIPGFISETSIQQHFMLLMQHAANEDFARRNLSVKYAFIATHLGMFFRFDPLFDKLRATALWKNPGVHKIVGLNRMFDHVDLMIAEGLINRNTGFAPGLLEACEMPKSTAPRDAVSRAAPKRAKALGADAMERAFAAAVEHCAPGAPLADCAPRDAVIAAHFRGYGFWSDPLYNWVPAVLAEEGLTGLGDKLNG